MPDHLNNILAPAFMLAVPAFILFLLVIILRFCITDARRRGKSPLFVSIACILFFPWGTIAWLIFRPDPQDGPGSSTRFRLEDHRLQ
jgi:hypothetical protein